LLLFLEGAQFQPTQTLYQKFEKNRVESGKSTNKICHELNLEQPPIPISFAPVNFDKIKGISYLNLSWCRLSNDDFQSNISKEPGFVPGIAAPT